MATAVSAPARVRWGDVDDEEDALPPPSVSGPDARGVKTAVEYRRNERGEAVKVTTKTRVSKVERKVYTAAEARKSWARFGDAAAEAATDSITVQANEDIPFERVRAAKQTQDERKQAADMKSVLAGSDKSAIVGSLKDLLYKRRMERQLAAARGLISGPELPPDEDGPGGGGGGPGGLLPTAGAKGGYVPPSVRARAAGATSGGAIMGDLPRRDDNSVRVTNLSEDTREDDLRDLFAPFGQITRVYIAVDRETGESRGFGFVNFMFRADAERAIDKLDGFGYDNLILRVEFAAPRPERPM